MVGDAVVIKIAASLSVILCLAACAGDIMNTEPEVQGLEGAAPLQTLTNPQGTQSVTLRPGGQVKLLLSSNPTTGYFWYVKPDSSDKLTLLESYYDADPVPEGIVGSGGVQTFLFEATDVTGRQTLKFSYQRSDFDVADGFVLKTKVTD